MVSSLPVIAVPEYALQLQSVSATAIVAGEAATLTFGGASLNNIALMLVADLNVSAELAASAPDWSTLPALDLLDWPHSLSAYEQWSAANGYQPVYANASGISSTLSASSLTVQLPALGVAGYHRLLVVSPNSTANLTDWLFVVPLVCPTLLLLDGECLPSCPTGTFCLGDGRGWPLPGWWSVSEHSVPTSCALSSSCAGALDLAPSSDSPDPVLNSDGTRNTQRCSKDYGEQLCASCDSDYYHDGLACRYCGTDNGGQLAGLLIAAIVIFALLTLIVTVTAPLSLTSQVGLVLVLQQVVTVGQTAAQYLPASAAWLAAVFRDLSLLNLSISMFQPGCLIAQLSFVQVFWVTLALIALLGLLFTLAAALRAAVQQRLINQGSLCCCGAGQDAGGAAGAAAPGTAGFLPRMKYLLSLNARLRDEACVALPAGLGLARVVQLAVRSPLVAQHDRAGSGGLPAADHRLPADAVLRPGQRP